MSSRTSPLWPYFLVLASLFALTIAIPTWQTVRQKSQPPVAQRPVRSASCERQLASVMVVRPTPSSSIAPTSEGTLDEGPSFADIATTARSGFSNLIRGPLVETVAKKIADLRRFGKAQPPISKPAPPADRAIDFPVTNFSASPFPASDSPLGANGGSSIWHGTSKTAIGLQQLYSIVAKRLPAVVEAGSPSPLPSPDALIKQLDHVKQFDTCAAWAEKTESLCRKLCAVSPENHGRVGEVVRQLNSQIAEVEDLARGQTSAQAAVELRRIRYALQRRLALWEPVLELPSHGSVFANIIASEDQSAAVEVPDLLASIEQYEQHGLVSDARVIAAASRQLKYSNLDGHRQLAEQIDEHYRNANVRMAFTGELLSRLLPDQPPISGVVNDRILGTPVRGVSDTTTRLEVRLIPDSSRIHLWLEARGNVDSLTSSSRGPVTLSDRGESAYVVHKAVIIDERGMGIAKAMAEADSRTQLVGVSTRFDGRPLVGAMVRDRAVAKYDKQHAQALREVDQKVANEAAQRVDTNAREALDDIESLIVKQMMSPLERMSVAADPVSFNTTSQRVAMRLRLAGENQLGGHTARPQAPSDSLASMQVHESALNNVLDGLDLAGSTFTLPDLFIHLAKRTGKPIGVPADLPDDVSITFAQRDPVHVRCQGGLVHVTLGVAEFQQSGHTWRNFSISADYKPEIDHLHARLVRSGPIQLGGETYKGQAEVTLRTAFSKIFPRDRKLDLVPAALTDNPRLAGLSLTQCVVDDGWIGIAISQNRTAMTADTVVSR